MLAKLVSPPASGSARASSMLSATGRSMKPWSVCQRSSPSPASPLATPSSTRFEMMLISGKPGTVIAAVRVWASGGSIAPKRRARRMKLGSSIAPPRKRSTRWSWSARRMTANPASSSSARSTPSTSAPSAAPLGRMRISVVVASCIGSPPPAWLEPQRRRRARRWRSRNLGRARPRAHPTSKPIRGPDATSFAGAAPAVRFAAQARRRGPAPRLGAVRHPNPRAAGPGRHIEVAERHLRSDRHGDCGRPRSPNLRPALNLP